MQKFLGLVCFIVSFGSFGQGTLAIIKDNDGFVNVRAGADFKSEVIGKIVDGEPFEYTETTSDWFKISKPTHRKPVEGFVHKSRIKPLHELERIEQRKLIDAIFARELELIKVRSFGAEYNNHHEPKFDFILRFAADFIVENKDDGLMRNLIETIKLNIGSADEHPSWILGYIFNQSPDWTILQMNAVGLDKMLIESLEFGFSNVVYDLKKTRRIEELQEKIESLKK